jgi:hypothetical protein
MNFPQIQRLFDPVWRAIEDLRRRLNKIPVHFPPQRPGPVFWSGVITGVVGQTAGRYTALARSAPIDPATLGVLKPANWGGASEVDIEVWDAPETARWSPPLKVGEVFHGVQIGWRGLGDGSSGSTSSSGDDTPETIVPIIALNRSPGALIGVIVCNGPHGELDFTDNRQWVHVLDINATCAQTDAWGLVEAAQIVDPCPDAGSIPFIVAAVNLANQVTGRHEYPGKYVLLTPLIAYAGGGDPNTVRYACEYVDRNDNGERCHHSSSSSSSSSSSGSSGSSTSSSSNPGSCDNPIINVTDTATTITFHFCNGATKTINKCCNGSSSGSGSGSTGSGGSGGSGSGVSGPCPCDTETFGSLFPTITGTETDATGTHDRTFVYNATTGEWDAPNDKLTYDPATCTFTWINTGSDFRATRVTTSCDPLGSYTVVTEDGNAPHTGVSVH